MTSLTSAVLFGLLAAVLVPSASAQYIPPRPGQPGYQDPLSRHVVLSPEEIARHQAEMDALEARCDEIGREDCLRERQQGIDARYRSVSVQNGAAIAASLGIVVALVWWSRRRGSARGAAAPTPEGDKRDVAMIDLVVDRATAAELRRELDVTAGADARTAVAAIARAIASKSWTHAAVRHWPESDADLGERRYDALLGEIAARAAADVPRTPGSGYRDVPEAGDEGLFTLLTLTVLANVPIHEQGGAPGDAARATLEQLGRLRPADVERVHITFFPPDPSEAATASELVARAPRLAPIAR